MTIPKGAGIQVQPDELIRHAGSVYGVDDELAKAANAASTISLNHDAFGVLIGFVGSWFQDKEQDLAGKYAQTVADLRTDGAHLRAAAADYTRADSDASRRVSDAGKGSGIELPL